MKRNGTFRQTKKMEKSRTPKPVKMKKLPFKCNSLSLGQKSIKKQSVFLEEVIPLVEPSYWVLWVLHRGVGPLRGSTFGDPRESKGTLCISNNGLSGCRSPGICTLVNRRALASASSSD